MKALFSEKLNVGVFGLMREYEIELNWIIFLFIEIFH